MKRPYMAPFVTEMTTLTLMFLPLLHALTRVSSSLRILNPCGGWVVLVLVFRHGPLAEAAYDDDLMFGPPELREG